MLIWDTATHKVIANLEGHTSFINSIAFWPRDKSLITASSDGSVRFWRTNSDGYKFDDRFPMDVSSSPAQVIAMSHDGNDAAIGYQNGAVRLIGRGAFLSSDYSIHEQTYLGQKSPVSSLSFAPGDKILATGREDGTIQLWARVKWHSLRSALEWSDPSEYQDLTTFKSHTEAVTSLDFSPDGNVLASSSKDHTVRLWEIGPQIFKLLPLRGASAVSTLALSADGKALAVGSVDATVTLCTTDAARNCTTWSSPTGSVKAMTLSPDGKMLAIAGPSNNVELWSVGLSNGQPITLAGHTDIVNAITFSRDGHRLATGSHDQTIRLWDVDSGRQLKMIQLDNPASRSIALSPDGSMLAYRVFGGVVIKSLNSEAKPVEIIVDRDNVATSIAFSATDSKMLAIGTQKGTVKLVKLAPPGSSPAIYRSEKLEGHAGPVNAVAFSPDGKTLASGGDDETIKLWSVASYKELITLKGHTKSVTSLVFEPNGKWLASGSYDNTVRFWYAATWDDFLHRPKIRIDERAF